MLASLISRLTCHTSHLEMEMEKFLCGIGRPRNYTASSVHTKVCALVARGILMKLPNLLPAVGTD